MYCILFFFFQAEDGIRDVAVTGVQTCALPISAHLPKTSAVVSSRPAATSSSMVLDRVSNRSVSSRSARISRVASIDSRSFTRESRKSLSTRYFGGWRRFSTNTTRFAVASFKYVFSLSRRSVAVTFLTAMEARAIESLPNVRYAQSNVHLMSNAVKLRAGGAGGSGAAWGRRRTPLPSEPRSLKGGYPPIARGGQSDRSRLTVVRGAAGTGR